MYSKLDDFMRFCYEHGGTLKAHKMFGELYQQAAAELAQLRQEWNAAMKANAEVAKINTDLVEENAQLRQELADAKNHYIRGGDGSHWDGCEETHWDCKIAKLERENAELRKIVDQVRKWNLQEALDWLDAHPAQKEG
jgi:hypothetical protein